MGFLCKLIGHKMVSSMTLDTINPQTGEIGRTSYCDRCSHSKFEGIGEYSGKRVKELIDAEVNILLREAFGSPLDSAKRIKNLLNRIM